MRQAIWAVAIVLLFYGQGPAHGQASKGFFGGSKSVKLQPIDTTKAVGAAPKIEKTLSKIAPSINSTINGAVPSPLPKPSTFASTKYPNTFQPMAPIRNPDAGGKWRIPSQAATNAAMQNNKKIFPDYEKFKKNSKTGLASIFSLFF